MEPAPSLPFVAPELLTALADPSGLRLDCNEAWREVFGDDGLWGRLIDVNLTGTMRCVRAAMAHMVPRGRGAIVTNASVLGWRAQPGQTAYAASKAGIMALTRCAAMEAAPHEFWQAVEEILSNKTPKKTPKLKKVLVYNFSNQFKK